MASAPKSRKPPPGVPKRKNPASKAGRERVAAINTGKNTPPSVTRKTLVTTLKTPLTDRQRLYVNAVARDGLNTSAAIRAAGYGQLSGGMRNRLVKNPKLLHAIAIEREKFEKAGQMSKKKVLDGLLEAIEIAKIQADPTPMIQGWAQIAKMCGYMEPTRHKIEVTVEGNVVIQRLQQLDDSALLALADGNADAIDAEFTRVEE